MAIAALLLGRPQAFGQCATPQVRYYASTQQVNAGALAYVDNAANAVDGNPATLSTLNRLVGVGPLITVTQFLQFGNPVSPATSLSAGTAVTLKLTLPSGLLSLLGGVEIQPFKYLNNSNPLVGWQATAVGSPISGATLLGLLSGVGDQEVTVIPTGNFDGVWVKLSGVAVGQSIGVYDAYVMQPATTNVACNAPIDVESGVKPITDLASIGTALGTVQNPQNAIDADPNSYAEIDAVVSTLSEVYHTTIFNSPTQMGDTVKMIIQNSGPGLLDLNLSSGFSVQLYNGATAVGSPITYSTSSLALKLLPLASNKYELDISPPTTAVYDRVQVSVGGIATIGLTKGLLIYDVKRVLATPVINNGSASTLTSICQGNTTTLTVNNAQSCTTYQWFDSGGNLLTTSTSYTTPNTLTAGTYIYHVIATRNGCTETSTSTPDTVVVNPLPAVTPGTANVCAGKPSATLNYTNGINTPTNYSITWDPSATNFVAVPSTALPSPTAGAITIAVPTGTNTGSYTGKLTVTNANGCSSNPIPITIQVNALPASPVLTIN